MYMLDTNICIYIIKKQPPKVLQRFEQLPIGSVLMSLVTYGELEYGALKSNNSKKALGVLEELVNYIPVIPLKTAVAKHYAVIRANLESKGTPIGNNDLWIAAHARSLKHILVSNNVREFNRVENLELENWL
jgi:tRNA(fMet)-specific endonuclease VapC